jgi:SAM-dependent methyltransferase
VIKKYFADMTFDADQANRKIIYGLIEYNPEAVLLDTGCGNCSHTLQLAKIIGTQNIVGIDAAPEYIVPNEYTHKVEIIKADLNEVLPFPDNHFDVIHSNQVLEHLFNTDIYVSELYRILKPNGYAIVSTPNLAAWYTISFLFMGLQPTSLPVSDRAKLGNKYDPANPNHSKYQRPHPYHEHLRLCTYGGIKALFQYYRFKIKSIVGAGYYPFKGKLAGLLSKLDPKHGVTLTIKVRK